MNRRREIVPEPIRPGPARHPLAASLTVMEAVARCHGAMTPERVHDWLDAGLRTTEEPAGLVLEHSQVASAKSAGGVWLDPRWSGH